MELPYLVDVGCSVAPQNQGIGWGPRARRLGGSWLLRPGEVAPAIELGEQIHDTSESRVHLDRRIREKIGIANPVDAADQKRRCLLRILQGAEQEQREVDRQ